MLKSYFQNLYNTTKTGDATEESYYPDLKRLIENWSEKKNKKYYITSLPKRTEGGNPDFRIWDGKQHIIGYIEAKKPTTENLDAVSASDQLKRYRDTFPNLILTNFFEFRLYRKGDLIDKAVIGQPFVMHELKTVPPVGNEDKFLELLEKFFSFSVPKTTTAKQLAIELAKRTRFLRDNVIEEELREERVKEIQILEGFYKAFKDHLISSLTLKDFSNLFAQTITYGLFAARSRAEDGFNRKLAYDYIPHTIGILRDVFRFISSTDLPRSMEWIIDDIAEVLDATDVKKIIHDFYKEGKGKDPIIHFYETFLSEYDPAEREKRGVYYTPEPVVRYIVRSVHRLLKEKFGKRDGFATSSVTVLDPAAGTLTFPAFAIQEAVDEYKRKYGIGGIKALIKDHILKNFYAFELMMAPYAVGHLKIGFVLDELGYKLSEKERFNLYLTNSLEAKDLTQSEIPGLISLSKESRLAGKVKREVPILVIISNPPYSVSSDNKSIFIEGGRVPEKISKNRKKVIKYRYVSGLMDLYKEDVRSERNIQPLSDDYIKFIRFAHWKIEQAGKGVIGFITNSSYLSGLIHRGMRKKLAECFDEIYILNLHGNSLIGETAPNGGKDENVFDIRQGVAIALFVKTGEAKKKLADVFYHDLYGLRGDVDKKGTKYHFLWNNEVNTTDWVKLNLTPPRYFFVRKDFKMQDIYDRFIPLVDIFDSKTTGVKTHRDHFILANSVNALRGKLETFMNKDFSSEMLKSALGLKEIKRYNLEEIRTKFTNEGIKESLFRKYSYRPFDEKTIYYSKLLIERPRNKMLWDVNDKNLALITTRQLARLPFNHVFIASKTPDICLISLNTKESSYVFPLYLYNEPEKESSNPHGSVMMLFDKPREDGYTAKKSNIELRLFDNLQKIFNNKLSAEDIFYYIYSILYSNIYRKKYQEFLKIDFPRIPFTKDYVVFKKLEKLGKELVGIHLLKSPKLNNLVVKFYGKNNNLVEGRQYDEKRRRVHINDKQYFGKVEPTVWSYYIGGYQVLDKWLKDRKERYLSSEDIKHYCRVVTALAKTVELQKEIDALYPKVEASLLKIKNGKYT